MVRSLRRLLGHLTAVMNRESRSPHGVSPLVITHLTKVCEQLTAIEASDRETLIMVLSNKTKLASAVSSSTLEALVARLLRTAPPSKPVADKPVLGPPKAAGEGFRLVYRGEGPVSINASDNASQTPQIDDSNANEDPA
jgi:hypothetical protein